MSDSKYIERGVPSRESRLDVSLAFDGKASELISCSKRGCSSCVDRSFTQAGQCAQMAPLFSSAMLENNVVISHSPAGCSVMLASLALFNGMNRTDRGLPPADAHGITTNLNEQDVIYGGSDKLERAILDVEKRYHPASITISTSCASGIIGDDIEAVIKKVQPQVKAKIIPIYCEGFKSQATGTADDMFLHSLLSAIEEPRERKKDTILVVAPFSVGRKNQLEIERLLNKIGVKVNWFPLYISREDIKRAAEVAGAASICPMMSDLFVKELGERFGVPFVEPPMPAGIKFTDWWLRDVGRLLHKEAEVEALITEEHARIHDEYETLKKDLEGKRVFVVQRLGKGASVMNLIAEMGVKILGFGTNEFSNGCGLRYVEKLQAQHGDFRLHLSSWQPAEYANIFPQEKPDLVFGDTAMVAWGIRQGYPGFGIFIHTFFFGYDGALNIARELVKALKNPVLTDGFAKHVDFPYKESWYSEPASKYLVERS